MKFAIILFCFISLVYSEVELAFKVSGRNLKNKDTTNTAPPHTQVSISMEYPGYYHQPSVNSELIDSNTDPDWTKEFFFVYPEGVNATFVMKVVERNKAWSFNTEIGKQTFIGADLLEKGVLVKRLIPDYSMQIIVTQTYPTHPTCTCSCN